MLVFPITYLINWFLIFKSDFFWSVMWSCSLYCNQNAKEMFGMRRTGARMHLRCAAWQTRPLIKIFWNVLVKLSHVLNITFIIPINVWKIFLLSIQLPARSKLLFRCLILTNIANRQKYTEGRVFFPIRGKYAGWDCFREKYTANDYFREKYTGQLSGKIRRYTFTSALIHGENFE